MWLQLLLLLEMVLMSLLLLMLWWLMLGEMVQWWGLAWVEAVEEEGGGVCFEVWGTS